ncbi:neuron-specific vesicular protein calcyon isoform X3 [Emydura macquarii macquarii]|uniref:neuron-specific vesicular protein calcyon isoform X3 n=1 Tax=Emydura macquarii macquarii TaxID=1129001 RepID=UPI00352A6148
MIGLPVRGRSASTLNRPVPAGPEHRSLTMVKLGSNLSKKPDKEPGAAVGGDDSFDNIPLITPLDVSQLQQPFPDKVIVKTRTEYQLQQKKKRKLHVPGIKKLNINLYDEVSEKVKLTGLILITMAFLACLLMLVMYKALWYDQLSCPEGFVFKGRTSLSVGEAGLTPACASCGDSGSARLGSRQKFEPALHVKLQTQKVNWLQ